MRPSPRDVLRLPTRQPSPILPQSSPLPNLEERKVAFDLFSPARHDGCNLNSPIRLRRLGRSMIGNYSLCAKPLPNAAAVAPHSPQLRRKPPTSTGAAGAECRRLGHATAFVSAMPATALATSNAFRQLPEDRISSFLTYASKSDSRRCRRPSHFGRAP